MEVKELEAFDKRVFAVTERWNTPAIVTVFRWITLFGNFQTLLAVIVVTTGFLLAYGPRAFLLPSWVAILGSELTTPGEAGNSPLKPGAAGVPLRREGVVAVFPAAASPFPAVSRMVPDVIARDVGRPAPSCLVFGHLRWCCFIALSRVMLHVHYASDVLAGLLVGAFGCSGDRHGRAPSRAAPRMAISVRLIKHLPQIARIGTIFPRPISGGEVGARERGDGQFRGRLDGSLAGQHCRRRHIPPAGGPLRAWRCRGASARHGGTRGAPGGGRRRR